VRKVKKPVQTKQTSTSRKASASESSRSATSEVETVTVDRRGGDRRHSTERRQQESPVAVERRKGPRRKVQRRRQIDPTTCERDYTAEELEFMGAMDAYKRASGRMFPTCSEVLEVLRGLGYEKRPVVVEQASVVVVESIVAVETASQSTVA
jgi:hypothetical protein